MTDLSPSNSVQLNEKKSNDIGLSRDAANPQAPSSSSEVLLNNEKV